MLKSIYERAFQVILKKPLKLWGITLLGSLMVGAISSALSFVPLASVAVSCVFGPAMVMIYLRGYRGENVEIDDLFVTCRDWEILKRVLGGMAWMYLWIFLWSLIPIVGIYFGIVRAYEYRLTPYILMQEPSVGVTDAIKVSAERTRGHKMTMFLADFVYGLVLAGALLVVCLFVIVPLLGILVVAAAFFAVALIAPLFGGLVQAVVYEDIMGTAPSADNDGGNDGGNSGGAGYCPACGSKLEEAAAFCPNCGANLQS